MSETRADAIVIGAGIAGLVTALSLAADGRRTIVLSKVAFGTGASTGLAQGGIAAAIGDDDAPALHAQDTLAAAGGIADTKAVELLVDGAADAIDTLVGLGVGFDRDANGDLALGREAAHGRRRIVHAGGDSTGRVVLDALVAAARRLPAVTLVENADARLLLKAEGAVAGVLAVVEGRPVVFEAPAVVLASGGIGGLFTATTNPLVSCGDGLALALRAGARCSDLEFVQFHPTALAAEGMDPMPLVTEALRGEGALLVDDLGNRFMTAVHPSAELAPRDVVARATFERIVAGHRVFLDTREAVRPEDFPSHFPTVLSACLSAGVDPRLEPIPVAPAAHYHMGGVLVDPFGRTSVAGLWACGEVAATGVHGANRLASNSLLEGVVFARRAARDIALRISERSVPRAAIELPAEAAAGLHPRAAVASRELRAVAYERAGVVREGAALQAGLDALERLAAAGIDDIDRIYVVRCILTAALERRESRGSHFRTDFPQPSGAYAHRSRLDPVVRSA